MQAPSLVSIVTPSFNQGKYLRRTIDSVLAQTYPHIEYLVMDGGSTDNSVAILESYGSAFHWESTPDRGQTHAINKGLAQVSGNILAYLNSDDVLFPSTIEKVVSHFEENPNWDMVFGRADYIDESDCFLGEYATRPFNLDLLAENCFICQPAAFWRRRVVEKIGPFDESLKFCMDYEYWIRMADAGFHLEYVEDKLAASRMYPQTKTASCRKEIYRESIAICRNYFGSVSPTIYKGLRLEEAAVSSKGKS